MANVITLGLSKIEVGAVASDGGMGTTLATLGYTYADTCKLTMEDPEMTEHYAEEVDFPVAVNGRIGKTSLAFSLMDPAPDVLATLLGGTSTGSPAQWDSPSTMVFIEKSIKVTPSKGLIVTIPRGLVTAKIAAEFSKKGLFLLEVNVKVLHPTKTAVQPISAKAQS